MNKIIVTPAGRQRYLEVLLQNLLKNRSEFDVWKIWVNTNNQEDIEYMKSIERLHDFIELVYCRIPIYTNSSGTNNASIHSFFLDCVDPNSVYLRLDDDIVYIHPGSISTMFDSRIQDEAPLIMYGNIINNSAITHLHQRIGALPLTKKVEYSCGCDVGWGDPEFAYSIHQNFIDKHKSGKLEDFFMSNWNLYDYARVSINCICFLGKTFAEFGGRVGIDEEQWLAVDAPRHLSRPNRIIGNTLFSHYAFFSQRPYLDTTDILSKYRDISQ